MKDKCHLSSFSALTVIPIFLLVKFLILRYDDSTVQCEGEIDFFVSFCRFADEKHQQRCPALDLSKCISDVRKTRNEKGRPMNS